MADAETRDVERPRETAPVAAPAEPATARALWPTFMRRTLAEDALRREATPRA
jgi:hypothetical protein